jgi:hypothetical protein
MNDEERIQHAARDGFCAILDTLGIDRSFSEITDESFTLVFGAVVALAAKLAHHSRDPPSVAKSLSKVIRKVVANSALADDEADSDREKGN